MVQVQLGWNAYSTAARRHAGGVAAAKLARAVMAAKTKLDGYMMAGYYSQVQMRDREMLSVFDLNDRGFEKGCLE
jgi:hypothetical protein